MRGTLCDIYTIWKESYFVGVLDNYPLLSSSLDYSLTSSVFPTPKGFKTHVFGSNRVFLMFELYYE